MTFSFRKHHFGLLNDLDKIENVNGGFAQETTTKRRAPAGP